MNDFVFPPDAPAVCLEKESKIVDRLRHPNGHNSPIPLKEIPLGMGYGIVLDGRYVLHDTDKPEIVPPWDAELPSTWMQKTAKGVHRLYSLPPGVNAAEFMNDKLFNQNGVLYGDLKISGYFVGPGSTVRTKEGSLHTYTCISNVAPAPYPGRLKPRRSSIDRQIAARDGVQNGMHADFLFRMASSARGQGGLSGDALLQFIKHGPLSVLQDLNEDDPFTDDKLQAIVNSVTKFDPEFTLEEEDESNGKLVSINMGEDDLWLPPQPWLISNFIPQNQLTLVYGRGGVGKSSLASYFVYKALKKGLKVVFFASEEEPQLFAARMLLTGEVTQDMLNRLDYVPKGIEFPKGAASLVEFVEENDVQMVYFDSMMTHFPSGQVGNEATRARTTLAPLVDLAKSKGVTIVGTFHENKGGSFLGSEEMRNVGRTLLHATLGKNGKMQLRVDKSNFHMPDYALECDAYQAVLLSRSGRKWEIEDEDGKLSDRLAFGIRGLNPVGQEEEVYEVQEEDSIDSAIRAANLLEPTKGEKKLADDFGVTRHRVRVALGRG